MKKTLGIGSSLYSPSMIMKAAQRVTASALLRQTAERKLTKHAKSKSEETLVKDSEFITLRDEFYLQRDNHLSAIASYEGVKSAS